MKELCLVTVFALFLVVAMDYYEPDKPEGPLVVSDVQADRCKLSWNKPKHTGGSPPIVYIVAKRDILTSKFTQVGTVRSDKTEMEVTGLEQGHSYQFRVTAFNEEGESEPLYTDHDTVAKNPYDEPDPPSLPVIADWDENSVKLKCKPPILENGAPVRGYNIEVMEKDRGEFVKAVEIQGNGCEGTVPNLEEGKQYKFRIRAVNMYGQSEPSENTEWHTAKPRFYRTKTRCPSWQQESLKLFPCGGYKYMSQAEAWFKIHTSVAQWGDAVRICWEEEAHLASPTDEVKDSMILLMQENNIPLVYTASRHAGDDKYSDKHVLYDNGTLIYRSPEWYLFYICYKKAPKDSRCEKLPDFGNSIVRLREPPFSFPYDYYYEYFPDAEAWFKIHTSAASWCNALSSCQREGAKLASATNDFYKIAMLVLMHTANYTAIHTAFRSENDGFSIALSNEATFEIVSQFSYLPYICYKKEPLGFQFNECGGSSDPEYIYNKETNKCYKFHNDRKNWTSARETCLKESGHLVIINSRSEANIFRLMFNLQNLATKNWEDIPHNAYIGFRAYDKKNWLTIQGQSLSKAGFEGWSPGEPSNDEGNEYCGSIRFTGDLDDVSCDLQLPFICEKFNGYLPTTK